MSTDPVSPPADLIDSAAAGTAAMRGGFVRAAGFAASLAIGLASAPLLVRHLGDVEFGRYSTALAIVAVAVGLTEGGVSTVALRELAITREPQARRRLMSDLLGLRLVMSAAGMAIAVGFTALAGYGANLTLGVLLAGAGAALAVTQTLLAVALQSQLRFGWAALIELSRGVVGIGLIVALVLGDAGMVVLLAVAIPAGAVALVLTVPLVRGQVSLRPAFRPRRWSPLLREVLVIAIAVAVYAVYMRVALLITSLVSTPDETGFFAISYRLMEALIAVPILLVGSAFPIISRSARDDRERFDYACRRIFELSLFLGGLISLGLLLSAPFAIQVLVGVSDHPSVEVLQIQSLALAPAFVVAATSFPLLGMRRHREVLIANSATLVLVVVLALALTPSLGAVGAAIAAVVADAMLAVMTTAMLMRKGGPSLPLSSVGVLLVAGLSGYASGRLIALHPVADAIIACLVFLALLALMRRFPPELRELLTSGRTRS